MARTGQCRISKERKYPRLQAQHQCPHRTAETCDQNTFQCKAASLPAGGGINISPMLTRVFQEVVERDRCSGCNYYYGTVQFLPTIRFYRKSLACSGAYAANMAVSKCDVLFPLEHVLTTESQESFHEFALMQIIHIDIDTATLSETSR